jgi:hypothetical protein
MMPPERVVKALETRTIEIAPLAFMRGRTLGDAFVILDEAQNATNLQMKMFLTRLGVNSKIVITGDKTQIDLPKREDSGLMQVERSCTGSRGSASTTSATRTSSGTAWCARSSRRTPSTRATDVHRRGRHVTPTEYGAVNLWLQTDPDDPGGRADDGGATRALRLHGPRALVALALAVLTYLLFPSVPASDTPLYDVGSVAPETVVAPFAFRVRRTPPRWRPNGPRPRAARGPYSSAGPRRSTRRARGSPRSSAPSRRPPPSGRRRSRSPTACASRGRNSPSSDRRPHGGPCSPRPSRRSPARCRVESRATATLRVRAPTRRRGAAARADSAAIRLPLGLAAFLAGAERVAEGGPVARALLVKLLSASFEPTLVYDRVATEARRASAAASVDATRYRVARGERVVGAHEVVGREEFDKLARCATRPTRVASATGGVAPESPARRAPRSPTCSSSPCSWCSSGSSVPRCTARCARWGRSPGRSRWCSARPRSRRASRRTARSTCPWRSRR